MATEFKDVGNVEVHPDDLGSAIQLSQEVDETKNSPWTKSMFRLCEFELSPVKKVALLMPDSVRSCPVSLLSLRMFERFRRITYG